MSSTAGPAPETDEPYGWELDWSFAQLAASLVVAPVVDHHAVR